jgi:hypothetical protein
MIIATLLILGAGLLFLSIAFVAVLFCIVLPMREELKNRITAIPFEQVEAVSKRADEIALASKTNHLDVRGDVWRLNRRIEDLEIVAYERKTREMPS